MTKGNQKCIGAAPIFIIKEIIINLNIEFSYIKFFRVNNLIIIVNKKIIEASDCKIK